MKGHNCFVLVVVVGPSVVVVGGMMNSCHMVRFAAVGVVAVVVEGMLVVEGLWIERFEVGLVGGIVVEEGDWCGYQLLDIRNRRIETIGKWIWERWVRGKVSNE